MKEDIGCNAVGGLGFANGGPFTVGAGASMGNIPGLDNRIGVFRVQDSEPATVSALSETSTADQTVRRFTFNVNIPDAASSRRVGDCVRARMSRGLQRANQRNN